MIFRNNSQDGMAKTNFTFKKDLKYVLQSEKPVTMRKAPVNERNVKDSLKLLSDNIELNYREIETKTRANEALREENCCLHGVIKKLEEDKRCLQLVLGDILARVREKGPHRQQTATASELERRNSLQARQIAKRLNGGSLPVQAEDVSGDWQCSFLDPTESLV